MQGLAVRDERDARHVRIHVSGEVDIATAPQLAAGLREHAHASVVEVDLRDVTFMDSTGVRLLVAAAADARRDGRTLELALSEPVRRIVSVLGLEHELPQLDAVGD